MRKAETSLRKIAKVADWIIWGSILGCAAILLHYAYYYSWTHQRSFLSPVGPMLYYGLPAAVAGLLLVSLRLRPSHRINLSLLLLSLGISLYTAELVLAFFNSDGDVDLQMANAKKLGITFDTRSMLEVIRDLQKQQIHAAPSVFPHMLLEKQGEGTRKSKIIINGTELLPLGGIANRMIVFCRDSETGAYVMYESDEHGFHNPKGIWNTNRMDIAAVGDSFVEGYCVPFEKNFVALIRKRVPLTLNLGKMGNGPLIEFATLKEYLPALKPKVMLWFYFEENDYFDLEKERQASLLMSYLSNNFTQRLQHRQAEIDQELVTLIERWSHAEMASRRREKIITIFNLSHLRTRLGLPSGEFADEQAVDIARELDVELFGSILLQAQTLVTTWDGTLYFIYLPERARYASPEKANKDRDRVLALIKTLGLPLIDMHSVFQAHRDPVALFPLRKGTHYTEEGNRLIAEEVLRSIAQSSMMSRQESVR
jgi:hypothetical protein